MTERSERSGEEFPVCTHCGFTFSEYRARGLLGCPHCYAAFGDALQADVAWLHQALAFAEPEAPRGKAEAAPQGSAATHATDPAQLRRLIADAVRREDYAEAARLQTLIRSAGPGPEAELGLA